MERINYKVFFKSINCAMIIFLEDDFSLNLSDINKSKLLYSITRMDVESKERFFAELQKENSSFASSIKKYTEFMEQLFPLINWDNVIKYDIDSAMGLIKEIQPNQYNQLIDLYNDIKLPDINSIEKLLLKYGLCINIPSCYQEIFDEYILTENRWKPVRIYANYDSESKNSFLNDLKEFYNPTLAECACLCCIIDNELSSEKMANDIINDIKDFNSDKRNSIIGAIVTSHEKIENIDEYVFLEYVNKNLVNNHLQSALLKSTYNYALSKLRDEFIKGINLSFSKATINRNIAFYLSHMAVYEGIANYQIINTWIKTLCDYELTKSQVLLYIVRLTNLINQIEVEDSLISEDLNMLNTFEAFDYNVNKFYQPPAAGDVFIFKDENENGKEKVYILVGQDCDLMMSKTRNRKDTILELVEAEIQPQTEVFKMESNLSYLMINNFRKSPEDTPCCLKINYTKRVCVENELLNLCTYDSNGNCCIDLDKELSEEQIEIMNPYLIDRYSIIKKYFCALKRLKDQAAGDLGIILSDEYSPRLIQINNYNVTENKISYPLRRICRMTETYVHYLYKLYLEYRGRLPYNSINLTRCQTLDISIVDSEISGYITVHVIFSGDRNINIKKPEKLPWEISKAEIKRILLKFGIVASPIIKNEYISLEDKETNIVLDNGKVMSVNRIRKRGVKLEIKEKI